MIDVNQETNDFLKFNLNEAHSIFSNIIKEMEQADIPFEYEFVKQKEMNSYEIIRDILIKMDNAVYEYDDLISDNRDLFDDTNKLYLKYIALYVISIIFIRVYHEIFSTEKFNEFWHFLVGLFLGSTYIGLLNRDINEHKSDTKEKRDLINRLRTLREEYKENHDAVVNEIDYIFALNDNLWEELDKGKKLVKNK